MQMSLAGFNFSEEEVVMSEEIKSKFEIAARYLCSEDCKENDVICEECDCWKSFEKDLRLHVCALKQLPGIMVNSLFAEESK